jgi:hypothetical protein
MPPRVNGKKKVQAKPNVVVDGDANDSDEVDSGTPQMPSKERREQEDALIKCAANIGQGTSVDPMTSVTAGPKKRSRVPGEEQHEAGLKKPKKKKTLVADLHGFADLKDASDTSPTSNKKAKKPILAHLILATHMQGANKGKLTGKVYYALNCIFEENAAFEEIVQSVVHVKPKWFPDWGSLAVPVPTAQLALKIHQAVKTNGTMTKTANLVNAELDVSAFKNPATKKFHFTLATSAEQFETRMEKLPRSIMIAGNAYDFKECLKEQFNEIRYLDLIFNGATTTKAAWILPVSAQTRETGTLASFLKSLGVKVTEVDLDEDEDEDDEDEELGDDEEGEGFIAEEALEAYEDDA